MIGFMSFGRLAVTIEGFFDYSEITMISELNKTAERSIKQIKTNKIICSPMNYIGGKYKLLPQILPLFPNNINTFVDLFCGGCNIGINVNAEGKLCGDVKFDDCVDKASMITPVPAGVGSVTTSVLAKHVVKACKMLNNIQ